MVKTVALLWPSCHCESGRLRTAGARPSRVRHRAGAGLGSAVPDRPDRQDHAGAGGYTAQNQVQAATQWLHGHQR